MFQGRFRARQGLPALALLFALNVTVPPSLADGDQPITAAYNGSTAQAGALDTVHH